MIKRAPMVPAAILAGALLLQAQPGLAVRPPKSGSAPNRATPALKTARGEKVRAYASLSASAPQAAMRAWTDFLADAGASWRAVWDPATGVPSRLFGAGLEVPGSVSSPGIAARHARAFLARHIDLLAPGASPRDFTLVSDVVFHGMRSVGFVQTFHGMPVVGGQVSFRYKNDRLFMIGSEARPFVGARFGLKPVGDSFARKTARAWIAAEAATARASSVDGPFVLPLIGQSRVLRYVTVLRVTVDARRPIGRWRVYLDAYTGERVARRQTLMFADGTVLYRAPVRYPGSSHDDYPARDAEVTVNGSGASTDAEGLVSWDGEGSATVVTHTTGSLVQVANQAGDDATASFTLDPGGSIVWDPGQSELVDAQIDTFIHAREVKEFSRTLNPDLAWLDKPLTANVNVDDNCNAFSDGNTVNFFVSSPECENTGRLADVVYHEFGHSLHAHSIIDGVGAFDGAHSEGLSDFLAASITGDPAMGRGFFRSNAPLRDLDPSDKEYKWPDDIAGIHHTGLIFAGAMWDLRKVLIEKYGPEEGTKLTERLYYATLQRATNIPTTYFEVLAEDDDDGDLSNGTPNVCDINSTFGIHGLRAVAADIDALAAEMPGEDGYPVGLHATGLYAQCPGDSIESATIVWKVRGDEETGGEVEMDGADGSYQGFIPPDVPDGSVIKYRIELQFTDGLTRSFPDNPADPDYEFFAGEVVPLYCTGFDSDPFEEGWTHGLSAGDPSDGADDWMWGSPVATPASGDPGAAFSGDAVIGNDLGGGDFDGSYQPDKVNFAQSPTVEVGDYTDVHLQYWRWLNVEDGFFDQASIYANDQLAWQNYNSDNGNNSSTHHNDHEWRFHDVPLSKFAEDGAVQVKYELSSDGGLQFGGWTIDDFCIVAYAGSICGDGKVTGVETCDDAGDNSDSEPNACRTSCRQAFCGDGVLDDGEQCDDGNGDPGDDCTPTCELPATSGGCGCRAGDGRGLPATGTLLFVLLLGLVWRSRRRR